MDDAKRIGRGYDKTAVEAFVNRVCLLLEDLEDRHRKLRADHDNTWTELTARRSGFLPDNSLSGPLADLLTTMQRTAMQQGDETLQLATEQSRQMVEAAQEQGRYIVEAAQAEADEILAEANAQTTTQADEYRRFAASMLNWLNEGLDVASSAQARFTARLEALTTADPARAQPAAPDQN
ncbi:hypothetical protein [Planosporangium mesophilum]|uniref:hypothetical protein n=1 Tax=Planosporangium mesophilum TaxID=689768 RepID=UPI001439E16C|nr:hypothetical protein [Planosporangium mesophilum]NJC85903.1 hypothetical protein [Planosporangium mesophilum]